MLEAGILGTSRISQNDNVLCYMEKWFREVFLDVTTVLVEWAGAAFGPSFTGLHLLSEKRCTKGFKVLSCHMCPHILNWCLFKRLLRSRNKNIGILMHLKKRFLWRIVAYFCIGKSSGQYVGGGGDARAFCIS